MASTPPAGAAHSSGMPCRPSGASYAATSATSPARSARLRELQELRLAIAVARGEITQRLGREASVHDISRALGASPEMVRRAQLAASNQHPHSLDTAANGDHTAG